jgi:CRP-like cAMP-binding protein
VNPVDNGYCLPFPLTHAQIGSAIGSTRVTVTRLMGKLRQRGLISTQGDNLICLPTESVVSQTPFAVHPEQPF